MSRIESHANCLLCGDKHPDGFHLRFRPDGAGGVTGAFRGRVELQGYDGLLHGGVIAALLDAAMTNCLFARGIEAVTGELAVRYRHPTPCEAALELSARLVGERTRLFRLEAELRRDGVIMASASAKFLRRN